MAAIIEKKALYDEELMLQLLSLKSEQIMRSGEIVYNIFNLIKSKQVNCYRYLKEYLKVLLQGFFKY